METSNQLEKYNDEFIRQVAGPTLTSSSGHDTKLTSIVFTTLSSSNATSNANTNSVRQTTGRITSSGRTNRTTINEELDESLDDSQTNPFVAIDEL